MYNLFLVNTIYEYDFDEETDETIDPSKSYSLVYIPKLDIL